MYKVHSAELLRAHSGERLMSLQTAAHSTTAAPCSIALCTLAPTHFDKTGEVLTFSDRTKQTLE